MEISFDPAKRAANLVKHGLDLADAARLSGDRLDRYDDAAEYGEDRWISFGLIDKEVVVCV